MALSRPQTAGYSRPVYAPLAKGYGLPSQGASTMLPPPTSTPPINASSLFDPQQQVGNTSSVLTVQQLFTNHPELADRINALGCGVVVVTHLTVRRLHPPPSNVSPQLEYCATLTAGGRSFCTEPTVLMNDFTNGWTLTFRDIQIIFPLDANFDGRNGITVSVHSDDGGTVQFGSTVCRQPREWCALSRPRGEAQMIFHEVFPQTVATLSQQQQAQSTPTTASRRSESSASATPTTAPPPVASTGSSSSAHGLPMTNPYYGSGFARKTGAQRIAPLQIRPSTAGIFGRTPLQGAASMSSSPYVLNDNLTRNPPLPPPTASTPPLFGNSPVSADGRPLLSPRTLRSLPAQPSTPTHQSAASKDDGSPIPSSSPGGSSALVPRTVELSDWLIEGVPIATLEKKLPKGERRAQPLIYLVVRFAHSERKLTPAPALDPKSSAARGEEKTNEEITRDAEIERRDRLRQLGIDVSDDETECHDSLLRMASWPHITLSFDVPMFLRETTAYVSVYLSDSNPEGGLFLAETSCTIDLSSPAAGSKVARKLLFTGETPCVVFFTSQTCFHEPRKEGAGGRPTSAFPRRPNNNLNSPISNSPPGGNNGNSSVVTAAVPPSVEGGGKIRPTSASVSQDSRRLSKTTSSTSAAAPRYDNSLGLEEEELPDDDFVVRDVDDDDDDDLGVTDDVAYDHHRVPPIRQQSGLASNTSPTKQSTRSSTSLPQPTGARATKQSSSKHKKYGDDDDDDGDGDDMCYDAEDTDGAGEDEDAAPPIAVLDAMVAEFEVRLRQVITGAFQPTLDKLEAVEKRITVVEERLHAQLFNEATGSGRTSPCPPPPPPTTSTAPQRVGSATGSRPSSGESFRGGAAMGPYGSIPEHPNPLFSELQLRHRFALYDTEDTGYITKAQFVHFYRTHNSFSADESNEEVEDELRKYAKGLDNDEVSFDEFCRLALRLAKF